MSKVSAEHAETINKQVQRIHAAVNDGTLDRATVNDALAELTKLAADEKKDSFTEFSGQAPQPLPASSGPAQSGPESQG